MAEFSPEALDLLARQDGVAARTQLLGRGITEDALRWNAGRGWRVLLPSVYLIGGRETTERRRQVAALLWAGAAGVLGGPTAARWHGITSADPHGRVHVVVPSPQRSRRAGFAEIRRSQLIDHQTVTRGPVRVCSAARAAVDAAAAARTPDTRSAILIEAVQRRLATVDEVAEWVHRLRPRDAFRVRAALDDAAVGAWSVPEAALLALVSTSTRLPAPWANPGLTAAGAALTIPDVWFDDVAMAVMVHSHRYHANGDDFDSTIEADGDLTAAGVIVVGVTPHRIAHDPAAVLRRIERTYLTASARPRPAVTAMPQHAARPGSAG
ncbi:MAG: hypothetical protein ACRCYX_00955 [Dermatophilaceae bacterium]